MPESTQEVRVQVLCRESGEGNPIKIRMQNHALDVDSLHKDTSITLTKKETLALIWNLARGMAIHEKSNWKLVLFEVVRGNVQR